jgi:hypothetical protein
METDGLERATAAGPLSSASDPLRIATVRTRPAPVRPRMHCFVRRNGRKVLQKTTVG